MAGMKKERDFRREVREEVYQVALEKGKTEGIQQGAEKRSAEIALNMISAGFDNAKIHELTGLSESKIEELRKA